MHIFQDLFQHKTLELYIKRR